jgi:hypothetical protein
MANEESITYRRSKVCNLLILCRTNSISDRLLKVCTSPMVPDFFTASCAVG